MANFSVVEGTQVSEKGESPIFFGLGSIKDYEPPRFIDFAKSSRAWMHNGVSLASPYVDDNGDLISKPAGGPAYVDILIRADYFDEAYGPINMKVQWSGSATTNPTVYGDGVGSVNTSVPGQTTFVFNPPGTTANWDVFIRFTPDLDGSNNVTGDPIRVSCIDTAYETEWLAGDIFWPPMVSVTSGIAAGYRYMDWLETNNNELVTWAERPVMTNNTYASGTPPSYPTDFGCPLELCIEFANHTNTHMWVNIPHGADDDYVRNAAELILSELNDGLHVWVEYSNEVWNNQFDQHDYARAQALAEFGDEEHWAHWQAKRSTEIAIIFRDVWFAQLSRLHPVLGSWTNSTSTTTALLYPTEWEAADPSGYVDPKTVHGEVAITGYFYANIDNTKASAIWTALQTSQSAAIEVLMDYLDADIVGRWDADITSQNAIIEAAGLAMTMYEGQSHTPLAYAESTLLYQRDWLVEDATAYTIGETVQTTSGVEGEVLAASGHLLTVANGSFPNIRDSVTGLTSGEVQSFITRLNVGAEASNYTIGETVTQAVPGSPRTGTVLSAGTGDPYLSVKMTDGAFWYLSDYPVVGATSGASAIPATSSQLHHQPGSDVPRTGVADVFYEGYQTTRYGECITLALETWKAANGRYWNHFLDGGRRTEGSCWGTVQGPSEAGNGPLTALAAWKAANPRHFLRS